MIRIENILESYTNRHPEGDSSPLQRAYIFSSRKHEGQVRRSGQPYMIHPVAVAKIVADMGLCSASICAALLHDTVEDTPTTFDEIKEIFGEEVSDLVDGLTKLSAVSFVPREERHAESFRKMLVATAQDIRVLVIKLADRLHNMSTLEHMDRDEQERIAQETRDIYSPLANRLGIHWLKADIDDLAFKYLQPDIYADLVKQVAKSKKSRIAYIERTKKELMKLMAGANHQVSISGRQKNLYSIYQKMVSKGLDYEKVYDAIAFRIICENVPECYAVFGLIHAKLVPVPGRVKDYIAMPKPNHYRSLHTTVIGHEGNRMEIQIRTDEMHRVDEYGIAAHWTYKEGTDNKSAKAFNWLREMLEHLDELKDSQEFLDSVKVDLFLDEVFVFTPAGDVISLRNGATPLDFAYAIHSEVGDHCTGARVNGVQVPFSTQLKNGDSIEVTTSKTQRPSSDWLEVVVTSKARNKIRSYLRIEQRAQSVQVGRDMLEKSLRQYGCSFNRMSKSGEVDRVARTYKMNNTEELLAAVGYGKIDKGSVVDRLLPEDKRQSPPSEIKESPFEKVIRKVKGQDSGIILDGVNNLLIRFARCCNPLPGESVIGYISKGGRGIVVHRRGCSKAAALDTDRQTNVQWSENAVAERPVRLQVITSNRAGLLADLSNAFQSAGINIDSAHCDVDDINHAVNTFTFHVKNFDQLNSLIRALKQNKDVLDVERIHQ